MNDLWSLAVSSAFLLQLEHLREDCLQLQSSLPLVVASLLLRESWCLHRDGAGESAPMSVQLQCVRAQRVAEAETVRPSVPISDL